MLVAMNDRSFVVTTAYLKTEAIQTAIFGFVFLGDHLTVLKVIAILIATVGVVITALRPGGEKRFADLKPTMIGLVAAAAFALSAIGFRGAILALPGVSFVTAASYTLVFGLFVQTLVLTIYLLARAPDVLRKILGLWKPSMFAGFMGAFASQFWFLAFALTAAANVRTLALVEVLFAQAVAYYSFKQPLSARELSGHRADRDRRGVAGGGIVSFGGERAEAGSDSGRAQTRPHELASIRSSGSTGSGDTSMPSSISERASSGEPRHRSGDARYRRNASCALRWENARRHCRHS